MVKCKLLKTQETVDMIFGLYDRLDIMEEIMGETLMNVEGVNLPNVWEKMFKELNQKFKDTQETPFIEMSESDTAKLLYFADLAGTMFSFHGSDEDREFLKNLTVLFEQSNMGGKKYTMEECWKYIKG